MQQFDYSALKRGFNCSSQADGQSWNHNIGEELLARLDYIKIAPQRILDLGAGSGQLTKALQKRYPKAEVIGCDLAECHMQKAQKQRGWFSKTEYLTANFTALPFAKHSMDLVFSNLALYWAEDLKLVIAEIARVLKPGGVLLFSSLGPDSLLELRQSFAEVDSLPHVNIFLDMHDIGDSLLSAGLKDPVMDVERQKLSYPDVKTLCRTLKASGNRNYLKDRRKTLSGKRYWQTIEQHYPKAQQGITVSLEVVFGHAWGNELRQQTDTTTGEVRVNISALLKRNR
jgi:malonyl-CoA O-methyltransferase